MKLPHPWYHIFFTYFIGSTTEYPGISYEEHCCYICKKIFRIEPKENRFETVNLMEKSK